MKSNILLKELDIAIALARKASAAILPYYYGSVDCETKEDGTPVTNADRLSNQIILDGLQSAFPHDGIVSEELENISGNRTWHVDPIDGTKGFIGHSDQFAIHIGLADGAPLLGLVYKPTTGEHYVATKGNGAFRVHPNGSRRQLYVSEPRQGLRIVTNTSFLREEPELAARLDADKVYVSGGFGLRVMRVTEGVADAYLKTRQWSGGSWDSCAPQAILEEAGGHAQYTSGEPITYIGQDFMSGQMVMARSKDVAQRVSEVMEQYAKG